MLGSKEKNFLIGKSIFVKVHGKGVLCLKLA